MVGDQTSSSSEWMYIERGKRGELIQCGVKSAKLENKMRWYMSNQSNIRWEKSFEKKSYLIEDWGVGVLTRGDLAHSVQPSSLLGTSLTFCLECISHVSHCNALEYIATHCVARALPVQMASFPGKSFTFYFMSHIAMHWNAGSVRMNLIFWYLECTLS